MGTLFALAAWLCSLFACPFLAVWYSTLGPGPGGAATRFPSRLCRLERELVPDMDGEDAGTQLDIRYTYMYHAGTHLDIYPSRSEWPRIRGLSEPSPSTFRAFIGY